MKRMLKAVFVDTDEPTISLIERYEPIVKHTNSTALVYKVMFSEDVTGVDRFDFTLSPTSTGEVVVISSDQSADSKSPHISNGGTGIMSDTITVSDFGTAASVSVAVDISYTSIGYLKVDLIAPDGTIRTLHDRTGGHDDDIIRAYMPDFDGVANHWKLDVAGVQGFFLLDCHAEQLDACN